MKGLRGVCAIVAGMVFALCCISAVHASSQPYLVEHGINFATGNKYLVATDVRLDGPVVLRFSRTYNSQSTESGMLGYGWSSVLSERVVEVAGAVTLVQADGRHVRFTANGDGSYSSALGARDRLVRQNGGFQLQKVNRELRDYDSQGRLLAVTQAGGMGFVYSYTGNELSSIRDTLGRELVLSYSGGRLSVLGTPVGEFHYSYDAGGNLVGVRYPDGRSVVYEYDSAHNLSGVMDGAGVRVQRLSYDSSDRVVSSELSEGRGRVSFGYPGVLSRTVTDAGGVVSSYELGVQGGVARVVRVQGPGCSSCGSGTGSSYEYTGRQQVASVTDAKGVVTSYSYDERGNRLSETEAVGTPLARTTSFTYTAENQIATKSEPSGSNPGQQAVTSYSYDAQGNLTGLTRRGYAGAEAISESWGYSYDELGRLIRVDGPRTDVDDTLTLEYYPNEAGQGHNRGQLRAITNALGQTTVYSEYSPLGKPGKITDANGVATLVSYNFRGDVLTRTTGNLTTGYGYDAAGRLLTVTLPGNRTISMTYSGDRLVSITDALGNAITYSYDALGRESGRELHDPENTLRYSLRFAYDQAGNLARRMYADNSEEQFAYDPVGNLVRAVDPLGVVSEYSYDALRRVLTEKRAGEQIAGYGYDGRDNIIGVTDARSHVTTSVYDDFGRERKVVSPDAGTNASVYDEAGNLLSQINALGERVELSWDALNRPLRLQWPGAVQAVTFIWDQGMAGRLASIREEEFDRHFSYTSQGQVAAESQTPGDIPVTVRYGYDESTGELSSISYPSGTVLEYSYDAAGQVSGLRFGAHELARDIRRLPFGPVRSATLGSLSLSRSYDQRYQLSHVQAGGLSYSYSRNAAGQVIGIEGLSVPRTESGTETYSIDAANNQLALRDGRSYSYDAAGRLLSDGTRRFSWDALGRLKTVERDGQVLASYGYDSQNRRVRKSVGARSTYYVYDLESRLIAELSGEGTVLREYIWLENEPLALREYELRPGLYFYINDHLATPQQLVDSQGTVVWQSAALPFGQSQVLVGTVQNNLRFPGQYYDAETGLHYNWNRYYDPDTGRYLSPDPIGLEGGLNLYAYVGNDPVNWVDPEGLAIGDPPSKYPPGYQPGTWIPGGGNGFWDPDGNFWSPHAEDEGHWPHWDKQYPDGKKERHPKKSKKPWPGQKKKPYGDQSAENPNKSPECEDNCKKTIAIGTILFIIYNICTGGAGV